ncbi:MAG: DUF1996 domain-containing protein [Pseudohongiellaceae bacterium]
MPKTLSKLFYLSALIASTASHAADSFDPATNTLTIPTVIVGDAIYYNVALELGTVLSVGGNSGDGVSVAPSDNAADTFDLATGQLTIPAVSALGKTYFDVVTTVGAVLSAGNSDGPSASTVYFASGPETQTTEPFASFKFLSSDASSYECALDDTTFSSCSSPLQLPSLNSAGLYDRLELGDRQLKVRATNKEGITGPTATWTWNVASIMEADSADFTAQRLIDQQVLPVAAGRDGWKGIFRINCEFDHAAYDDPIVFPGGSGQAHLHMFYGAKNVNANTNFNTLYSTAETGCSGGTLNRSSYWMPALLAPEYSGGEQALDSLGEPAWQVVPAKVGEGERSAAAAHEVFYYSAGVSDLDSIISPPTGLRIIAGNSNTTPNTDSQSTSIARWHCLSWGSTDANGGPWSSTIPECYADVNTPEMIRFDIFFPSCWNGVDLDSANHQDHMAYPVTLAGELVCPESHPKPIARVSYHYSFPIFAPMLDPETRTAKNFRLASDSYTVSNNDGGLSLHADWFNGWHPEAMDMLVKGCIQAARDCHDGNFALLSSEGDWSGSLSLGPLLNAKGSGAIPEIINGGLGTGHKH